MKQDANPQSPFSSPRRLSQDERAVRQLALISGALQSRLTSTGRSRSLLGSIDSSSDSSLDGVHRMLTFEQHGIFGHPALGSGGHHDSDEFEVPWEQF